MQKENSKQKMTLRFESQIAKEFSSYFDAALYLQLIINAQGCGLPSAAI
jgi:hypothetical protein